jgi:hypothetical protein
MAFPGILTRAEFSTGLNTKSICVNGNYLIVEDCNINQDQEHNLNNYIQGGPAYAIYNLGAKKYTGSVSFPLRVDQDGNLESAARILLQYAAKPMSALRIDTHHLLSSRTTTVINPGTDNNKNLSLDSVVINSLKLSASENNKIMVNLDITGMVDVERESTFNFSTDFILGRALSWAECNASRKESSMRTTSSIEVQIENELVTPVFLMPYLSSIGSGVTESNDQIELIGVQSTKWTGSFAEVIRNGVDLNTFIHGGLMHDSNLVLQFGPVTATFPNPVFKIGQTPLTAQIIRRTTEWAGINKPDASMNDSGLFTFV